MSTLKKDRRAGFIESFSNFLSDSDSLTKEDLQKELEEEGIDTKQLRERVAGIVKRESDRRRLAWREKAEEKRLRIEKMFSSRNMAAKGLKLLDQIRSVLQNNYSETALACAETYFRKKEDLSEKDLENLIQDLNDLNLLEDSNQKTDE